MARSFGDLCRLNKIIVAGVTVVALKFGLENFAVASVHETPDTAELLPEHGASAAPQQLSPSTTLSISIGVAPKELKESLRTGLNTERHQLRAERHTFRGTELHYFAVGTESSPDDITDNAVQEIVDETGEACNWKCYLQRYSDLMMAFGGKEQMAAAHYYNHGKAEGRNCECEEGQALACDCGDLKLGTCFGRDHTECEGCHSFDRYPTFLDSSVASQTAEIVVAHCGKQDLSWLHGVTGVLSPLLRVTRVTVYSKCGRRPVGLPASASLFNSSNVGRNDHTYANHIAQEYDDLADVVFFLKDTTFDYPVVEMQNLLTPMPELVANVLRDSFACVRRPEYNISIWHLRRQLWRFRLPKYISASEKDEVSFSFSVRGVPSGKLFEGTVGGDGKQQGLERALKELIAERTQTVASRNVFLKPILAGPLLSVQVLVRLRGQAQTRNTEVRLRSWISEGRFASSVRAEFRRFLQTAGIPNSSVEVANVSALQILAGADESQGFAAARGMCGFVASVLSPQELARLVSKELLPVCYGGSFVATSRNIRRLDRGSWRRLAAAMARGDNIQEGHYMERLWASLLSPLLPRPKEELLLRHSRGEVQQSEQMVFSYLGALKSCCCSLDPVNSSSAGDGGGGAGGGGGVTAWRDLEMLSNNAGMFSLQSAEESVAGLSASRMPLHSKSTTSAHPIILKNALLVSHMWRSVDDASLYLYDVAEWLVSSGLHVTAAGVTDGPLQAKYRKLGVETISQQTWQVSPHMKEERLVRWGKMIIRLAEGKAQWPLDLLIFNSVHWAPLISRWERHCITNPRVMWILHEWALSTDASTQGGFWWGKVFRHLRRKERVFQMVQGADAVVFVSEQQRGMWADVDGGNFHTLQARSSQVAGVSNITRSSLGIPPSGFVVTQTGCFSSREHQLWSIGALVALVERGVDAWLILVGGMEEHCSSLDTASAEYVKSVKAAAGAPEVRDRVKLVFAGLEADNYLLLSNLHLSPTKQSMHSRSALQAMSLGVPVVAMAADGVAERFQLDEVQWLLIQNASDPQEFLDVVLRAHRRGSGTLSEMAAALKGMAARSVSKFQEGLASIVGTLSQEWVESSRLLGHAAVCDLSPRCWRTSRL